MKQEHAIFANGVSDTKSLERLVDKLEEVSKELYHNKTGPLTQKVSNLGPSLSAIFTYLEKKGLEPEGDSNQKAFLDEIIKELRALPVVAVTLAFETDENFKNRLVEEIGNQVGSKIVLDIKTNYQIVAGLILEFNGKYKDYSLKPKLDQFLQDSLKNNLEKKTAELKEKAVF